MAEKRGNTGKLHYNFNQSGNLEVEMDGMWYRVTPRDFRSFNGTRRISGELYDGPTYLYGTNQIVETLDKVGIVHVDNTDPRNKLSKRHYERSQKNN
jgi:hypothetical protein